MRLAAALRQTGQDRASPLEKRYRFNQSLRNQNGLQRHHSTWKRMSWKRINFRSSRVDYHTSSRCSTFFPSGKTYLQKESLKLGLVEFASRAIYHTTPFAHPNAAPRSISHNNNVQ